MTSSRRPDRQPSYSRSPKSGSRTSPDRDRHHERDQHHPEDHPHPRPRHRPQKKPALPSRHKPHPEPLSPDQDPGPFADRPRPGKITKKATKTVSKR
ncbi:MAG: hypothetical protein NTY71_04705 [Methanoregula sp.]|nr:hypothetical protein [Methanoregula sp.]